MRKIKRLQDFIDFRSKYEPGRFRTRAGIFVRSKAELIIADILTELGISYCYEKMLILGGDRAYPDFYISEKNLVIEYHDGELENKKQLYTIYGIPHIILNEKDLTNIHDKLAQELLKYYPERICWT